MASGIVRRSAGGAGARTLDVGDVLEAHGVQGEGGAAGTGEEVEDGQDASPVHDSFA